MRSLVYAAAAYALVAGSAEAFSFAPGVGVATRSPLALRQASAVPTARLAKVTRPERKVGLARLAPLKMAVAESPTAQKILSNLSTNDASLFSKQYDLVIVGGDPSGLTAALSGVAQGRSVVIVDPSPVNRIPFASDLVSSGLKMVGAPATDYTTMDFRAALSKAAATIGKGGNWDKVRSAIAEEMAKNYEANVASLKSRDIPIVRGTGSIQGADASKVWSIDVKGTNGAGDGTLKAGKVLVAAGSKSVLSPNIEYDGAKGTFNGDSIQDLSYLPSTMTIVGNSLAMLEYAKSFTALGTKVTVVIQNRTAYEKNMARSQVPTELSSKFMSSLESAGVTVIYEDDVQSVSTTSSPASDPMSVTLSSGKTLKANALLTCLGRKAKLDNIGLDKINVGAACNPDGSVLVDYNFETTASGVYASGDAVGGPWMPNNGLNDVHDAVVRMFGLRSMTSKSMPERHADFLAKSFNAAGYADSMDRAFPGVIDEESFIEYMTKVVGKNGFNPDSSINLVSTCRDEICRPFTEKLDSMWGESFNIASLGGFVFCGKTGFGAGMAHAPIQDGKERYVFWVAPHIAYGIQHIAGKVFRPGRDGPSSACGALIALKGEITEAKMAIGLDPTDTEMSLLRQQILGKLEYGQVPNLVGITYAAHDCILDQVKNTAEAVINPDKCEYVIISGIQVHGALNKNFIWPGTMKKYVGGVETDLTPEYQEAIKDYNLNKWLQGQALNQVRANAKGGRLPAIFSDATL